MNTKLMYHSKVEITIVNMYCTSSTIKEYNYD